MWYLIPFPSYAQQTNQFAKTGHWSSYSSEYLLNKTDVCIRTIRKQKLWHQLDSVYAKNQWQKIVGHDIFDYHLWHEMLLCMGTLLLGLGLGLGLDLGQRQKDKQIAAKR